MAQGERLRIKWRKRIVERCHRLYFQSKHPYWLTPTGWDALSDEERLALDDSSSCACENPDQRVTAE